MEHCTTNRANRRPSEVPGGNSTCNESGKYLRGTDFNTYVNEKPSRPPKENCRSHTHKRRKTTKGLIQSLKHNTPLGSV